MYSLKAHCRFLVCLVNRPLWEGVAKESWGYTQGAYLGGLSETVAHILCEQGRHLIAQLQARALCHEPD